MMLTVAQCGLLLHHGDGIAIDKFLAGHYSKLAGDLAHANDGIPINQSLTM
jgi:hypothetical protein